MNQKNFKVEERDTEMINTVTINEREHSLPDFFEPSFFSESLKQSTLLEDRTKQFDSVTGYFRQTEVRNAQNGDQMYDRSSTSKYTRVSFLKFSNGNELLHLKEKNERWMGVLE